MADQKGSGGTISQMTYRWRCPICQNTNNGIATKMTPRKQAINALTSHIRIIDGEGHGPADQWPDRLNREALTQCVEADVKLA